MIAGCMGSFPAMNPSTAQATVVVDELVRCGVREAVLCPGSRNAPLSFALHAADAAGRLRLHVRIDERSAGFLAVGLGMRSGRPVPVVCTSGTAVANLHPAVLEAAHGGVPLIALTADRPPQLRGTGASQTIEQPGVFGSAVREAAELPVAERTSGQQARWRATVDRLVAAARSGPVHLNVALREPLVPDGNDDWPESLSGRPSGAPWTAVAVHESRIGLLPLDPKAPTLVIAGQGVDVSLPPGTPVLAEPGSPLWHRSLSAGVWLLPAVLSGELPGLLPEQVAVLGRPTLHRAVQRLLADERVAVYAVPSDSMWTDVPGTVRAVGELPENLAPPEDFATAWYRADHVAGEARDAVLAAQPWTTGPALAEAVIAAVPPGSLVLAGPSSPVRDIALAARPRDDVTLVANRGVAGIDGVVSTAIGAALAHPGRGYALLGDLTFLHDSNGLLLGPDEPRPDLTLVVANDRGGSVFTTLEQGAPEHAGSFERIFGTPVRADLGRLCRALDVDHVLVDDFEKVPDLLRAGRGLRVVEVPVDRSDRRALHGNLRAAVDSAVAGTGVTR